MVNFCVESNVRFFRKVARMMKRACRSAWIVLILAMPLFAIDLPKPPAGFTWQQIPELKAAFLKPDGWYFRREEDKGTAAFFITKESIANGGDFSTGLTINVFRGLSDPAVDRGKALVDQIAAKMHTTTWSHTVGPFQEFGCDAKDSESAMHYLTVANRKTNTLYLFIFESPVSDWGAAWKLGEQILDNFAIDDQF
jgi:hypothetical protein